MKRIPRLIHLIFLSKTEPYPPVFERCIARIKELHSAWTIKIYNEDDAIEVIEEHIPYLLPLYHSYEHLVQRADLFRLIIVYLFGGFYMDMDMFCLQPLNPLRKYDLVLGIEKVLTDEQLKRLRLKENIRVANYMFGGVPNNIFWLHLIRELINVASKSIVSENDILETTGPGILSDFWGQNKAMFPQAHLLENNRDCAVEKERHKQSCYFGEYAAHLHQGTWRWQSQVNNVHKVAAEAPTTISKMISMINERIESTTPLIK